MEELGVPPKQKERARQAFASSAESAGFIAPNGRFSKPALAPPSVTEKPEVKKGGNGGGAGGGDDAAPAAEGNGTQRKPEQEKSDADQLKGRLSDSALEYRLVDLITEAHQKAPEVVGHIIAVITFLKTKDVDSRVKAQGES